MNYRLVIILLTLFLAFTFLTSSCRDDENEEKGKNCRSAQFCRFNANDELVCVPITVCDDDDQ